MHESAFTSPSTAGEGLVTVEGELFYRIEAVDEIPPFLMSVVSSSDVWLFLASNGALTAGRRDPDHAVLPYYTEDKVVDGRGTTGAVTLVEGPWGSQGAPAVWEPWSDHPDTLGRRHRWLAKSLLGDEVLLVEERPDLGLTFTTSWTTSARYGVVRRCRLTLSSEVTVRVLDGLRNLIPAGATRQVQNELSVLLDAYKRSEIVHTLGIYSLSSQLSDRAVPAESLRATVAWRMGPDLDAMLAGERQIADFRAGRPCQDEVDVRGVRGAYLAAFTATAPPGHDVEWTTVIDTGLDTAAVADLAQALAEPQTLADSLRQDIADGRRRFRGLLAGCDGLQHTGDERASAHLLASVTFNAMRGGVPLDAHRVDPALFSAHVAQRDRRLGDRAADLLADLPDPATIADLHAAGRASGDPDLERLALEFLPLTFGRRHGDPSRPWNRFEIAITDSSGQPVVGYEGNWRDIFQNWEALAWSYPALIEPMICVFVSATTIDGYNPYRITHAGLDWEEPEPENPWANIGYWSDHQTVYLTRLLQASQRLHPGRLIELLDRAIFTTADVPYRIADLDSMLADPRDTISFDHDANRRARRRQSDIGGDGLLRRTSAGALHRSTLADKLLLLVAAKIVNLVPEAGVWMNTQRPEWNDANNALVGYGASVVTAAQLLGHLDVLDSLVDGRDLTVRTTLVTLLEQVRTVLDGSGDPSLVDATVRFEVTRGLGRAGERYRAAVYGDVDDTETTTVPAEQHAAFRSTIRAWLEATVASNRRSDGLFHSYNAVSWDESQMQVRRLPLMLEGQVAVLGSGLLSAEETVTLLQGLRDSDLYRADQHSYVLYPDRSLPGFLDRNTLAETPAWPSLDGLLADPDRPVVRQDGRGAIHFAADLANAGVLAERLDALVDTGRHPTLAADREAILDAYEETFQHRSFTGRSGSFFAYEGLGSIYWHMVSKLALAVREALETAKSSQPPDVVDALASAYANIRSGLGFAKDARTFGAFPTDPYSHTPAHAGARQPGMTGQVKEDILCRRLELGVQVKGGEILVDRTAVSESEWSTAAQEVELVGMDGATFTVHVPEGCLLFTICQVPFLVGRQQSGVEVWWSDSSVEQTDGPGIGPAASASILGRDGNVRMVRVGLSTSSG